MFTEKGSDIKGGQQHISVHCGKWSVLQIAIIMTEIGLEEKNSYFYLNPQHLPRLWS
jgi:hypothetical protein